MHCTQRCDIHCPEVLFPGDVLWDWVRPRVITARAYEAHSVDGCHLDKTGDKWWWPQQSERRKPLAGGQTLLCNLKVGRGLQPTN